MLGYTKFVHGLAMIHISTCVLLVKDAAYCEDQAPVPAGDGCGDELYSWFEPAKPGSGASKPKVTPPEPFLCQQVLSSSNSSEWLE